MDSASTSNAPAAAMLDEAPCGFLVFDDEGTMLLVNTTLCSLLKYEKSNLEGRKFETLLTIAGRIFYQTHLFPLIRLHGKAEEIFLTLRDADGNDIPVLVNALRKPDGSGYQNHCVLIPVYNRKRYEDELIQARKNLEQALNRNELLLNATAELEKHKMELDRQITRLSQINRDLVQFSNVISHDLQEPIRKIAMFGDIIFRENNGDLSDVSRSSLDKIKTASRRMRELISALQQYVSVDTVGSQFTSCDLTEIIERARMKAAIDTHFPDISLSTEGMVSVDGHWEQLELLFYHLFLNAIQFRSGSSARVKVTADIIQQNSFHSIEGKYNYIDFLRIKFSDEGRGFDLRYGEYIFQLFRKAHNDAPGLGFGLALCRKIVANHYGSITASADQSGATFLLMLPLKQQA